MGKTNKNTLAFLQSLGYWTRGNPECVCGDQR